MADDPYDFEIAIPAAQHGAKSKGAAKQDNAYGRHSGRATRSFEDDDEEYNDDDGDGSSVLGLSESEESDRHESNTRGAQSQSQRQSQSASALASRGTSGASALDKAKSFLSKYSVKTATSESKTSRQTEARRSRLDMSLDDLSLDSSGDEKPVQRRHAENRERSAPKERTASTRTQPTRRDSSSEESASMLSRDDETTTVVTATTTKISRQAVAEDSDEADFPLHQADTQAINSFDHSRPSNATPHVAVGIPIAVTKPTESDDEEFESISSRSADSSGHDVRHENTVASRAPGTADSGVYESDAFEEESRGDGFMNELDASKMLSEQPQATAVAKPPADSNFDYSMDFAEEENAVAPTLQIPPIQHSDSPPSERRSSRSIDNDEEGEEEERRSAFMDSDADDAPQDASRLENESQDPYAMEADDFESESAPLPVASGINPDNISSDERVNLCGKRLDDGHENHEENDAAHSIREQTQTDTGSQNMRSLPLPTPGATTEAPLESATKSIMSVTSERLKSRIIIVREYEQPRDAIEKKDASTQFTGNHAAIQTELVPDGMHTAWERQQKQDDTRDSTSTKTRDHIEKTDKPLTRESIPEFPPPAPSVDPTYGLYNSLELSAASSMSIYKQQLLAIQQNIHRKKLESERLFREKLAFRYSSLSQTEQFLSANRPRTVPLWQALMRVDPTMTEEKAREVAQLVEVSRSTTNA